MAHLLNRAKAYTATTGTGTVNIGANVTTFLDWDVAGAVTAKRYSYLIEDGSDWEVGEGLFTTGSPSTLTRTLVASSTGALLNLTGAATVACVANKNNYSKLSPFVRNAGVARYLPPDTLNFNTTTNVGVAGLIYYFPFSKECLIDALVAEITTLVAASNIRMALYDSTVDGLPGALIYDLGNVSSASTGLKTSVLPAAFYVDRLVYLARQESHAVTYRGGTETLIGLNRLFGSTSGGINVAAGTTRLTQAQAFGAFPANAAAAGSLTWNSGASMIAARTT